MWGSLRGSKGRNSSLHKAVYYDNKNAVRKMLQVSKESFLVYLENADGNTPLHVAVYYGNKYMMQQLLQFPDLLEIENKHGNRVLQIAAMRGTRDALQMLLDLNANLHTRNNLGNTALHIAADYQRFRNVQLLLEYGANVNVQSRKCKDTPLHIAVRGESKETVLTLLMYGANPNAINLYGLTPLFLAFSYPHITLDEMIHSDQNIMKLLIAFCVLYNINDWKACCITEELFRSCKPFYIECQEEISRAKLLISENSRLSYYDILECDIKQIAFLLRKKRMKVNLMSKLNLENFPIYSEMFDFKIDAAKKWKYLIKQSIKCLKDLCKDYLLLPDFIAENVLSNLDIGDLRNLIRSVALQN